MAQFDMKDQIELFIQGEGIPSITLIHVNLWDTVSDIVEAARKHGLSSPEGYEVFVLIEDSDVPLILDAKIEDTSLAMRSRVHIHRLKQVDVVVNFNADHLKASFPPSATVASVKNWSVGKEGFNMPTVDAAEHLLQVCGTSDRPSAYVHIGTLVGKSEWEICFDLVASQRVEG